MCGNTTLPILRRHRSERTQALRARILTSWPSSTEQPAKLFRLGISELRVPLSRNAALAIDLSDCPKRLDPALRRTACANLRISFTPEPSIYRFLSDVDPLKPVETRPKPPCGKRKEMPYTLANC